VHPPSTIIIGVCAGLAALDIALAVSSLSKIPSTLGRSPDRLKPPFSWGHHPFADLSNNPGVPC
jgi:hypothetical protein